jgi:hypothetical protein
VDESTTKGVQYTCITYPVTGTELLVSTSDGAIRQIVNSSSMNDLCTSEQTITCMTFTKKNTSGGPMLLCGTSLGTLRLISYPSTTDTRDITLHNGAITAIRVTDGNHVLTVSEDGSMFVLNVVSNHISDTKLSQDYQDYFMITKNTLSEHQTQLGKIHKKYKDLKARTEYELRIKELQYEEMLKQVQQEAETRHQQEMARYEELHKRKVNQELHSMEQVQALEREHIKSGEELEHSYEKKQQDALARYEELKNAKDDMQYQMEEQMRLIEQKHTIELENLRVELNHKLGSEQDRFGKLSRDIAYLNREHEEEIGQQEDEYEYEITAVQGENF